MSFSLSQPSMLRVDTKIALGSDFSVELVATNLAISYHMIFLSVCVGGIATDLTLYILVGIDLIINIFFVIQTWRAKRNPTEKNVEKLMKSVQILVLAESLEIIIPLAYLLCFIIAYHGPNAEILGNIKNSYWQYQVYSTYFSLKILPFSRTRQRTCFIVILRRWTTFLLQSVTFCFLSSSTCFPSSSLVCFSTARAQFQCTRCTCTS